MESIDRADLINKAQMMGIALSEFQALQFERFALLLNEWNQKINLTAVPLANYVERHFLDSLSLASIPEWTGQGNLVDVGTGAGLPGIPLKIAFPEIQLTLVESLNKKCLFLQTAVKELQLTSVKIITERAEIAAHNKQLRASFDFATARAVADLGVLCELLIPFAKIGGIIAPLKSQHIEEESDRARKATPKCGGEILRFAKVQIPECERQILIPIIKKVATSEDHLPRNYSAIQKKPLA